jgi:DNA-binding protein HU-beta
MNKTELIAAVAKKTGLTKVQAAEVVNVIFDTDPGKGVIAIAIDAGDTVTLPGFGTFATTTRQAREGRNPQTGQSLKIAARKVPVFRPGKGLKERVRV